MIILTLNIGSSSIKYSAFKLENQELIDNFSGQITGIGSHLSNWQSTHPLAEGIHSSPITNHAEAISQLANNIAHDILPSIVVHRIVHGGSLFTQPAILTPEVISQIEATIPLAPLHNPPQLDGIQLAKQFFNDATHVGIFDTAFHHTIPNHVRTYAIPKHLSEKHAIKKYGFHGTSYQYVAAKASTHLKKKTITAIILHLGNGASVCAVKNSQSLDTSMGLTPCSGLIMGSRTGDIDPGLSHFLVENEQYSSQEVDQLYNKESGLLGLCGQSDMRAILELVANGNLDAEHAIKAFVYRVQCYIGSYHAILGPIDALIFTGGIGENSAEIRRQICLNLDHLGIHLNDDKNHQKQDHDIHEVHDLSDATPILIVKTNEEKQMALEAIKVAL